MINARLNLGHLTFYAFMAVRVVFLPRLIEAGVFMNGL